MNSAYATPVASADRDRRFDGGLNAAFWFCLVAAVFLGARGYFGFVHDNILYLAQALARLQPEIFQGDIYLAWGSQDRYTLFSPLYAALIGRYGLEAANLLLVGSALSLFLFASFLFVRSWVPAGLRGYAMIFVAASNGLYGASFIFKMGEQFATPRPFVEAIVLFGAALLVSGHRAAAFVLVLLGGLLHPLVALSGFMFCWIYLVVADRRWLWMLLAGLALAALSLGVTVLGADLLRNVLITNLQVWRGMWLVHWLALAFLPWLLQRLWSGPPAGRLVAAAALFGFFLRGLPAGMYAAVFSVLLFFARDKLEMDRRIISLALWAFAAGAFVHWFGNADRAHARAIDISVTPGLYFVQEALTKPFVLVVIAVAVGWLGAQRRHPRMAALLALVLLATALATWDRRPPIKKYAETTPLGSNPFTRHVGPDQEVYWYEEPSAPWVLMQRRSYLSGAQAAGQMFNRATAMQLRERREVMNGLEFQEQFCQFMNKGNNRDDACVEDVQPLRDACRDAKGLDFIVLESRRGNVAMAVWTPPVEYPAYRPTYYLYDCKQLAGR